jgi:succinyl-diaminopimelate desuccinylase
MAGIDPVELTAELVRRPSLTPDEAGCFELIEAALRPLGFTVTRLAFASGADPPVPNLFATIGPPERAARVPHFAFNGHVDVVPPGEVDRWSVDPFGGVVRDGLLYGRGSADMKSGVAAFIAAAARWVENHEELPGRLSLLITADEEGPSIDGTARLLAWAVEQGHRFDACLVGEPTSSAHLGDMAKIGRRGSLTGLLEVHGRQGHTAYPQAADNAAHRLVAMLQALLAQPIDAGTAWFQPSNLQLTTIDIGNPVTNIIPGSARAGFNIRFNDSQSPESLERWLRARLDAASGSYRLRTVSSGGAFLTRPGPLSELLGEAVEAVTGLRPELSTSGGTSDARFIAPHCPVVEFGLVGRTIHQVDEHVPVAEIHGLSDIYTTLLNRWFTQAPPGVHRR